MSVKRKQTLGSKMFWETVDKTSSFITRLLRAFNVLISTTSFQMSHVPWCCFPKWQLNNVSAINLLPGISWESRLPNKIKYCSRICISWCGYLLHWLVSDCSVRCLPAASSLPILLCSSPLSPPLFFKKIVFYWLCYYNCSDFSLFATLHLAPSTPSGNRHIIVHVHESYI